MRKVLCGPFIGEFGWELFCWQGFLRKRRSDFDHMTVISRPGRGVLYEDFADEFIAVDISFDKINMWQGGSFRCAQGFCGINPEPIMSYYKQRGEFTDFIPFDSFKSRWWLGAEAQTRQKFIAYGGGESRYDPVDILVHIRNAFHCRSAFRNWKIDDAHRYVEWARSKGYSIGCVGKSESALWIEGTADYRDIELKDEVNLYSQCGVIVGSQSGPHHLACLCRLPVIAWQTKQEHVDRLTKYWNPFNVRTWTNPASDDHWKERRHWQPSIEWLQQATLEALGAKI